MCESNYFCYSTSCSTGSGRQGYNMVICSAYGYHYLEEAGCC